MNKLFSKIASLSVGLAMAVGVGVALGHESVKEVKAADQLVYTLDGTVTGGSSGYAVVSDITQSGIGWGVTANTTMNPWRFGGKNISTTDRAAESTVAVSSENISKVEVETGTANATVHSVSLLVGTTQGGSDIGSQSKTSGLTSTTLSFERPSNEDWTGRYFSIVFNVTCGSSSNQYIQLKSAKFYKEASTTGPFHVTYNGNGATSGSMTDSKEYESGETVTIMACEFMRDNYSVTGWNTQADGSGTSYVLSGTFEITADTTLYAQWKYVGPGSEDNPYTVAEAIAAIDANSFPTPAYVSGIICQIDSYDATHKSITYWISDDGSTTTKLEVYSGKGLNGAEFSAKEDIEVKATVTVTGTLMKYNSTYEFNYNNYQVSYVAPVHEDPTLKLDSVKGHLVLGSGSHSSTTVTASFESFSGTPTVSVVGEPAKVNVSIDGASITITAKSAGVETVTFRATYNSEVADVEYKVAVTTNEGTAVNPFTVSEARNVLDAMETVTGYVLGAISQIDSYDSTYHSITYWISDDGTTTDQLECYSGKGYNGANFSSKDDLTTGTMVVVSGTLKIYKSTYEFDKNNRITEFSRVENLATEILNRTYNVCHDYDGVTDNHDAIAAIWEILAGSGYYGDFTDTEKAFIQSIEAKEDGEFLEQAMARYDYLTGKYELTNFISGRTPVASYYTPAVALGSDNNSYIIIVVISAVSVMSFGLALFLRKKRSK